MLVRDSNFQQVSSDEGTGTNVPTLQLFRGEWEIREREILQILLPSFRFVVFCSLWNRIKTCLAATTAYFYRIMLFHSSAAAALVSFSGRKETKGILLHYKSKSSRANNKPTQEETSCTLIATIASMKKPTITFSSNQHFSFHWITKILHLCKLLIQTIGTISWKCSQVLSAGARIEMIMITFSFSFHLFHKVD